MSERVVLGSERPFVVREHLSRYEFACGFAAGQRVLDMACGSGYGTAMLQQAGAVETVGVDISADAIEYARRHFGSSGASFRVGSAEDPGLDRTFDLIVSLETIEHLQNAGAFLNSTTRLLSQDGRLIVSTPIRVRGTLDTSPENPHHVREWSADEFVALLGQYFGSLDVLGQFSFAKGWLPYSRTVKRWLFARRHATALETIDRLEVLRDAPRFAGFAFTMAYAVVVCREPKCRQTA